jgi:F0F1-type ATP synthase assembly protein I
MAADRQDPAELGYYFALAQVGMEMVAPIVLGVALDNYLGWRPWGVIGGAIVGFVGGLVHLIVMVNRHDAQDSKPRNDNQ